MIAQRRRFTTGLCLVALVLLSAWTPAFADTVAETQDTLFLVFANDGAFGTFRGEEGGEEGYEGYAYVQYENGGYGVVPTGGQSYTVVNFAQFLSGFPFPGGIPAIGASISGEALFAATGGLFGSFADLAGHEFFFIGSYVASDHLMYGSDSPDGPVVPEEVQEATIPGLMTMGGLDPALAGLGGVAVVGDAAFWAQMGLTPAQANQLLGAGVLASASAAGAGENVFGFSEASFIGIAGYQVGQDGGLGGRWEPVPEPGSCALLLLAGAAGGCRRLRRRRARAA